MHSRLQRTQWGNLLSVGISAGVVIVGTGIGLANDHLEVDCRNIRCKFGQHGISEINIRQIASIDSWSRPARSPSRISVKLLAGELPRVEMYFIALLASFLIPIPFKERGRE